jgi:hypothetical protein
VAHIFFLIGLIDNFLFSFLDLILACSEGNMLNHKSTKHKFEGTSCYLQYCVIVASDSLITLQLIEGNYQMDYLLLL